MKQFYCPTCIGTGESFPGCTCKACDGRGVRDVYTLAITTRPQREAIARKWKRDNMGMTYRQFRATVQAGHDCLMVKWCGMWLGIEPDGYTHS